MTEAGPVVALANRVDWLWLLALLFYGVGDTVTTLFGLATGRGTEAGPAVLALVELSGLPTIPVLLLLKVAVFVGFFALWRAVSSPGRIAVPLALTVVGVVVTGWNVSVVVS